MTSFQTYFGGVAMTAMGALLVACTAQQYGPQHTFLWLMVIAASVGPVALLLLLRRDRRHAAKLREIRAQMAAERELAH